MKLMTVLEGLRRERKGGDEEREETAGTEKGREGRSRKGERCGKQAGKRREKREEKTGMEGSDGKRG